ncbi:AAA family ATPase [Tenacibaculum aiptasiae]|uniref:AAA family ATPase n=1 Tax=Tenacibaculum aiptasiae TaxID=426481 RepID=UPI00232E97D6|nr:ATP-binding protein [Tenacibaculum aiptasiae]
MKLIIHKVNKEHFPEELLEPNFFLDKTETPFIKNTSNEGNATYVSSELDLNSMNFFVGANNSGKSRFMRGLLKTPVSNKTFLAKNKSIIELISIIDNAYLNTSANYGIAKEVLIELQELIRSLSFVPQKFEDIDFSSLVLDPDNSLEQIEDKLNDIENNQLKKIVENYISLFKELEEELSFIQKNEIDKKTYIPILRSLLRTEYLGEHSYDNTIKKVFFEENTLSSNINIETGLDLWGRIDKMGRTSKKRDITKFESFLSECFFEGKNVELLPSDESLKLISIAIDNGTFRSINEIGDGIQSLIILLFPIFTASENEVFYIEEPETNLHPGFQRIFIETLLTSKHILDKNLKFFFTTHSNHFLDLTLRNDKVSFFQFEKIEEGKHLIKTKIKPSKETLDLLGVNNTSVFLANTSLWVEGPTDRMYLSKFLKLYCEREDEKKPHLKEDIDFAFFEYGGNLIAHYLFEEDIDVDDEEVKDKINAFSSANKIYLLSDNDNPKENSKKEEREEKLKKVSQSNTNFKYQNTIVKEIENLLPVKVLKDFMLTLLKGKMNIKKVERISFERGLYKKVGLGKFYEELFEKYGLKEDDYNKFKADSGTLKADYKNKLARFVVEGEYTYDDLIKDNDVLKDLIENLYKFITEKKK